MFDILTNLEKLENGEIVELSIAQIVLALVNMTDAKNSLSQNDFEKVYGLFCEYMSDSTMNELKKMDAEKYIENCIEIIKSFDVLVPFEKYSGRDSDDIEFAMFLAEIREEVENENNMDEKFVLVKKALEDTKVEYSKIIGEMFLETENYEIEDKKIIECSKKYNDLLCEYVLKYLDEESKIDFIYYMKNPREIELLQYLDKTYFNVAGLNSSHILALLYYIDGMNIDTKKCLTLSKMQRDLMHEVLKEIYELEKEDNVENKIEKDICINKKNTSTEMFEAGACFFVVIVIISILFILLSAV